MMRGCCVCLLVAARLHAAEGLDVVCIFAVHYVLF